ncbi:hypothetical protein [Pantoea agglomerans]|uniref:hypothetical protein n=1 Tax=Enterobacter agglomerans TaxID=549 RepID=UPI00320ACE32
MDFETLKVVRKIINSAGSLIGVIGGLLGFYTFIDNNLLKFKPYLNISGRLFFSFDRTKNNSCFKGDIIKSIIFQIEVINGRNKIGRIDDFAIRIYNQSTTKPMTHMLYAENILDRLPSKATFFNKEKDNFFSPLSVLGRSTKNIVIEFTPDLYMDVHVPDGGFLKMELLYALPNNKWKIAGIYTPHHFKNHKEDETSKEVVEYSLLDYAVRRGKAKNILKEPESGLYKGVSGKYLGIIFRKPIWFIRKTLKYSLSIIKLMIDAIVLCVKHLISTKIIIQLINKKSKRLPGIKISNARAHLGADTVNALNDLKKKSNEIIKEINSNADNLAQIKLTSDQEGFFIQRARLTIRFYKSGDGHITVQDTEGYPQKYRFSMELCEYPFGIRMWKVNNKIMSLDTACVLFMDSFILLAH